jgi:hypothetical protein
MNCQWWSSTLAREPQDGPNVHHVLSLMFTITYLLYLSWVHGRKKVCVACIWFLRQSVVTRKLTITVTQELFLNPSFPPMAYELQTESSS